MTWHSKSLVFKAAYLILTAPTSLYLRPSAFPDSPNHCSKHHQQLTRHHVRSQDLAKICNCQRYWLVLQSSPPGLQRQSRSLRPKQGPQPTSCCQAVVQQHHRPMHFASEQRQSDRTERRDQGESNRRGSREEDRLGATWRQTRRGAQVLLCLFSLIFTRSVARQSLCYVDFFSGEKHIR
jgi:hypothetical protein